MSKYPTPQPILDGLEEIRHKIPPLTPILHPADWNCAIEFLQQYDGNMATFNAYRREVERLLQWSWLVKQTSILMLKRQDIEEYIAFCLKPPHSWISTQKSSRFKIQDDTKTVNPSWRPFVVNVSKPEHKQGIKSSKENYHLSQKAIREIFTVLGSFYNYLLLEEKVLAITPLL